MTTTEAKQVRCVWWQCTRTSSLLHTDKSGQMLPARQSRQMRHRGRRGLGELSFVARLSLLTVSHAPPLRRRKRGVWRPSTLIRRSPCSMFPAVLDIGGYMIGTLSPSSVRGGICTFVRTPSPSFSCGGICIFDTSALNVAREGMSLNPRFLYIRTYPIPYHSIRGCGV